MYSTIQEQDRELIWLLEIRRCLGVFEGIITVIPRLGCTPHEKADRGVPLPRTKTMNEKSDGGHGRVSVRVFLTVHTRLNVPPLWSPFTDCLLSTLFSFSV